MLKIKINMVIIGCMMFLLAEDFNLINKKIEEDTFSTSPQLQIRNFLYLNEEIKSRRWITLLSENFESGVIPVTWTIIDGNNDGFEWTAGTTDDLGEYPPPTYGTAYAYYSDDDAGKNVINYNEELWTPALGLSGVLKIKFKYGYGFQQYQVGEKYRICFRKKVANSWTEWIELKVYNTSCAGIDSFELINYLPCDSIQFRFFYSDTTSPSHWGWACACDNIIVKGFVLINHDVEVAQIVSPTGRVSIGQSVDVIVKYGNRGENSETFPAIVRIFTPSNTPVFSKDTILFLNAGEQLDVNFGEWIPTQTGYHFIYGKTFLIGDEIPQNDSMGISFYVTDWGSSWIPYPPPPLNSHRLAHATVYDPDNDKIYMIGGTPNGEPGSFLSCVYKYDPITSSWNTNLANMPDARGWIQGGYWNGRIYIPGGFTNTSTISNTFFIYDIGSNTWTIGPFLPEGRCAYGLAVWNGNIYVIGGIKPNGAGSNTVYRFNIENNQWTQASPIPRQFDMGGCCYLGDTIYLVGGYDRGMQQRWSKLLRGIINPTNPDQITWEWITNLPYPNSLNAACALSGKVYMIGGSYMDGTKKVWEYNVATHQWVEISNYVVPITRNNFAIIRPPIDETGARIYVVAGDANHNWSPPNNYYYYLEKAISVPERTSKENFRFFINPFVRNGQFFIYLTLKKKSNISLSIYNSVGQKIEEIYKGIKDEGSYIIKYKRKLNAGIYFLILKTPENLKSFKIIKIK